MPPRVFISYRSEDTGPTASRLARELERRFGRDAVFIDHERIEGGADWPARLRDEVRAARVVLVLVGRQWLTLQDPHTGDRRLNVPEDWVRREVEEALQGGRDVVPVLVEGATPLTRSALRTVESIARLADLQARKLRRDEWDGDLGRIEALLIERGFAPLAAPLPADDAQRAPVPPSAPPTASPARRVWPKVAGVAVVGVLAVLGVLVLRPKPPSAPPTAPASPSRPPSDTPAVAREVPPATAPTPTPVPAPASAAPPPAATAIALEGEVQVQRHLLKEYSELHGKFTVEARDRNRRETLGESGLREDMHFTIPVAAAAGAAREVELSWKWAEAHRFVLWPVIHPPASPPFQGYSFNRLDDVHQSEKSAALRDLGRGDFAGADQTLRRLEQLLDMYDRPQDTVIPGFTMGTLEFKLLQEICAAAAQYRDSVGRSQVSDEMIEREREWRKKQFAAARKTRQPAVDLARALNGWSEFSRQSYSRMQRSWPDRSALADTALLAEPRYERWLREDLDALVPQLRWLLDDEAADRLRRRLDAGQREVLEQAAAGRIDELGMSRLADLLSRLASP